MAAPDQEDAIKKPELEWRIGQTGTSRGADLLQLLQSSAPSVTDGICARTSLASPPMTVAGHNSPVVERHLSE